MNKYTKDEFFNKLDWEGGFDAMASYAGHVEITDDKDLNEAWKLFVSASDDLTDIYDEWNSMREQDDSDDQD